MADEKLLQQILQGTSDANIRCADLRGLLRSLGFNERNRGSHHIFSRDGVELVSKMVRWQPEGKKEGSGAGEVRQTKGDLAI